MYLLTFTDQQNTWNINTTDEPEQADIVTDGGPTSSRIPLKSKFVK